MKSIRHPYYSSASPPRRPPFTLVELLVVVAILAILASLLLPALHHAIEQGKTVVCRNNIRQYGFAMAIYRGENDSHFSPTYDFSRSPRKQYAEFIFGYDDYVGTTMERSKTKILQCVSWEGDRPFLPDGQGGYYMYSYSYNHNYIGRGSNPLRAGAVKSPSRTLLFGEPGYVFGVPPNTGIKGAVSLTAPFRDRPGAVSGGGAGTVFLRHESNTSTNVGWVDGHVSTLRTDDTTPAKRPYASHDPYVTDHPEFPFVRYIGEGNDDLYDLE